MTVNLYLNRKKESAEKGIYAYIREKGNTIVIHTGEYIEERYWNAAKQKAKRSYTGSPELNNFLLSFKETIKRVIREYRAEKPAATFDDVKQHILSYFNKDQKAKSVYEVFETYQKLRENELSKAMIKKNDVLRNHLQSFEQHTKYKITFQSLDMLFFDMFVNYLRNEKGLSNNTLAKYLDILRTFLSWSAARGFNKYSHYKDFRIKQDKTEIIALTEKELFELYEANLPERLSKVRDVFCFAAFTGARFSDVKNINHNDIQSNIWNSRVQKTKEILTVPLNKYALEILSKYKDQKQPLPIISSQKTNQYLKECCKAAKIETPITITKYVGSKKKQETKPKYELIGFHNARKTFVTLSLEKGMRPETVMGITGHQTHKQFKKYILVTDKNKQQEMTKIWNQEPTHLKLAK